VLTARLLKVTGKLQREGIVTHIIADKLEDISHLLEKLVCDEQSVSPITLHDEISHQSSPAKQVAIPRPRHPRDQARVLFPSRDFK